MKAHVTGTANAVVVRMAPLLRDPMRSLATTHAASLERHGSHATATNAPATHLVHS